MLEIILGALGDMAKHINKFYNIIIRHKELSKSQEKVDELKSLVNDGKATQEEYDEAKTRHGKLRTQIMLADLTDTAQNLKSMSQSAKTIKTQNEEIRASKIQGKPNSEYIHKNYGLGSDNT
jgi:hypothetical protein